jgi:hypothetical protein
LALNASLSALTGNPRDTMLFRAAAIRQLSIDWALAGELSGIRLTIKLIRSKLLNFIVKH